MCSRRGRTIIPSDPGIALIELLAWLAEMALYQVNIVTDRHTEAFLELLNGPEWALGTQDLDTAVHQTILALRDQYRAATAADFEYLARHKWPDAATLRRVRVAADLYIREPARSGDALLAATAVLTAYFDPLSGGPNGEGWPFGRGVYSSEIYALLNALDLVDYVEAVQLTGPDNTPQSVEVKLNRHELVAIDSGGLTAVDIYGNRYGMA